MIMIMVDNSNRTSAANLQFTWQAIFWRLLLTLLLLLALAGPGLTIFGAVTAKPDIGHPPHDTSSENRGRSIGEGVNRFLITGRALTSCIVRFFIWRISRLGVSCSLCTLLNGFCLHFW